MNSFSFPDQGDHDALDLEFFLRDEVGVTGVFGAQVGFATLHEEGFEGDLAVDEGGDDVICAWLNSVFDNGDVAADDMFANHGIALDLEAEGAGRGFNAEGFDINQYAAFLVLGSIGRQAGGDG